MINTYLLCPLYIDFKVVAYHQGLSLAHTSHPQGMLEDGRIGFVDPDIFRKHHPIKVMVDAGALHFARLQLSETVGKDIEPVSGTQIFKCLTGIRHQTPTKGKPLHGLSPEAGTYGIGIRHTSHT